MGFGIVLIGYGFMLLNEVGGSLFAALCCGYGFYLASRLNTKFMYAAVTALFLTPRGVVILLNILKVINIDELTVLNWVTFILHIVAWLSMTFFWMSAVYDIARDNNASKLERQTKRQLIITSVFLLIVLAVQILSSAGISIPGVGQIDILAYIFQYLIILYNLYFVHTCFLLIKSEKQYQRELQDLAAERADTLERRHKDAVEEAENNEKRRRR